MRLNELERQAEAARQLYQAVLQRSKETREEERLVEADARLVSRATPPLAPSSLGPKVFLLAGFLGSFLLSSGLALVLESLAKGLRSARETERATGLPVLALVPELALKRRQLPHQYLLDKPLSLYTEAIGAVFVAITSALGERGQIVLVTSSLPEEGKTTLVVSLGTFAARSGKRVLLLDLDLRHPSVHRNLGGPTPPGVVEVLEGSASLEEAVRKDEDTGVDFLPVKGRTANPIALLAGERMRALFAHLRDRYDLVLLDTAPVASVTDARILAPWLIGCSMWCSGTRPQLRSSPKRSRPCANSAPTSRASFLRGSISLNTRSMATPIATDTIKSHSGTTSTDPLYSKQLRCVRAQGTRPRARSGGTPEETAH